jgi:hypothetical protein
MNKNQTAIFLAFVISVVYIGRAESTFEIVKFLAIYAIGFFHYFLSQHFKDEKNK